MNAKELLERFDFAGFNPRAQETIIRALRLLAAAEGGDGTPETDALIRFEFTSDEQPFPAHALLAMTQWAKSLERERNALSARVRELEAGGDLHAMMERMSK